MSRAKPDRPATNLGRRAAEKRARGRTIRRVIIGLLLAGLVVLLIVMVRQDAGERATERATERFEAPEGTRTFTIDSADHVEADVDYPQTPPVGGPHWALWQTCGFYDEPIREESAVHSLEHGAVWITHDPALDSDAIDRLRQLASSRTKVLVSPYPDLPAPVVASAWGKQLELESVTDPRLERFVNAFHGSPDAPEPGATCSGGSGDPA